MTTTPVVSVIIPTRNRAHVLRRSIESVLNQTFSNLELIVVDDASEDLTASLVTAIRDPRVRYIRYDGHRGAAAARNVGLRAARGEYIAFQDSDDEWTRFKLERQLDLMSHYAPHADVATCGTETNRRGVIRTVVAARERLSYAGLLSFTEPPWGAQTILVRRTRATESVFFDETLPSGQDWDYVVRLAKVTNVVSVREPLVRIGLTSGGRISNPRRKLDGTRLLREKYDQELRLFPHAFVACEVRLFRLSLACGEMASARRHLLNAVMADPFQPQVRFLIRRAIARVLPVQRVLRRLAGATIGG